MTSAVCFDLHCHSTASDGVLAPADVVARAAEHGVDVLALTDHDVTDGIVEAQAAADECGLQLVPGVEVSVTWNKKLVHIVGLGIDPENVALQQGLASLREKRLIRAQKMAEKLEKAGVPDALAGAMRYAGGEVLSRTHFARYLVEIGLVKDFAAAFKRFLSHGKRGFVGVEWAGLEEALGWIHDAGGQAVIAHPARYSMSRTLLGALMDDFKKAGGAAIEVVSSSHTPGEVKSMAEMTNKYGLLSSCGSDFHGPGNKWAELGRLAPFPDGCQPVWKTWADFERIIPESINLLSKV